MSKVTINEVEYETKPQTNINLARAEVFYTRFGNLCLELTGKELPFDKIEGKLLEYEKCLNALLASMLVEPPKDLPFAPEHIQEIYSFFSKSLKASSNGAGTSGGSAKVQSAENSPQATVSTT